MPCLFRSADRAAALEAALALCAGRGQRTRAGQARELRAANASLEAALQAAPRRAQRAERRHTVSASCAWSHVA